MTALFQTSLVVLLLSAAAFTECAAQAIIYRADSAKVERAVAAGARLIHWVETVRGAGEHIIYVRNVSNRPVRVTSYEIYDCFELRGRACGVHSPGPVVHPGKTLRLTIIAFRNLRTARYKYRLSSEFADSTAADTTKH